MEDTLQFLVRHGYLVLFLFVLAEQIGLPLPAIPPLLAVGAPARNGSMDLVAAVLVAAAASPVCRHGLVRDRPPPLGPG